MRLRKYPLMWTRACRYSTRSLPYNRKESYLYVRSFLLFANYESSKAIVAVHRVCKYLLQIYLSLAERHRSHFLFIKLFILRSGFVILHVFIMTNIFIPKNSIIKTFAISGTANE